MAKSTPVLGVDQWNVNFIMSAYHAKYKVINSTRVSHYNHSNELHKSEIMKEVFKTCLQG